MSDVAGEETRAPALNEAPAPAPAQSPATAKADPTFAWTLAVLPLAAIPFTFMPDPWGWVAGGVVAVLTLVLAFADARQLKQAGWIVEPGYAIFGGLVYLISRTLRVKSTPALPVVAAASLAGVAAAVFWFAPDVWTFEPEEVEGGIHDWVESNYQVDSVVFCPSEIEGEVGDTFICDAEVDGSSVAFRVTIEGDGAISWVLIGG